MQLYARLELWFQPSLFLSASKEHYRHTIRFNMKLK